MSDTTLAFLVLPALAALVLVLECGRVGCTRLSRRVRNSRLERSRGSARSEA